MVRLRRQNEALKTEAKNLKRKNEVFQKKAADKLIQYKNLGKIVTNLVSIMARNVSLIKKEMNVMMNKLRYNVIKMSQ